MKRKIVSFIFLSLFIFFDLSARKSEMYHQNIHAVLSTYEWDNSYFSLDDCNAFDELILTWNGRRPTKGMFYFDICLKLDEGWSPWIHYAVWAPTWQRTFSYALESSFPLKIDQDTLVVTNGQVAKGYRIKITAVEGASLSSLDSLHVCVTSNENDLEVHVEQEKETCFLEVPGVSQMALHHHHRYQLCSPTSVAATISYLSERFIDPLSFARGVWDSEFQTYGNWVLNMAEAYVYLQGQYYCWVEHLSNFDELYRKLEEGFPVTISVRGPLKGSALPYAEGHLLVVIGFDSDTNEVLCMDPAFPENDETLVRYDLSELTEAWERRGKIAYIFSHKPSTVVKEIY